MSGHIPSFRLQRGLVFVLLLLFEECYCLLLKLPISHILDFVLLLIFFICCRYGHASPNKDHHYHHPDVGHSTPPLASQRVGFALDGFPIFGAVEDASVLDECNGRVVNGNYQYHVRSLDQVDGDGDYCNGDSPAIQWNYVLGCYHGALNLTSVASSTRSRIPSDCVAVKY